jgi:hypothetical protein
VRLRSCAPALPCRICTFCADASTHGCALLGISVGFNFLGRDFFNAISEKARTAAHSAPFPFSFTAKLTPLRPFTPPPNSTRMISTACCSLISPPSRAPSRCSCCATTGRACWRCAGGAG